MKALQLIMSTQTILGLWCKGIKRKRQKETVKKKSGTPNKGKTFYASVTFTRVSPIKTTTMSMWDHQSQISHSSNQWLNLPLSKLFHLPQRFQPQCNLCPSLQQLLHLQSLLLCLHRSQLHKAAIKAPGSRPFHKKTKKKNRSRREQVIEAPTPPPLHQPPTTPSLPKTMIQLPTPRLHDQKTPEVPLEPEATTFSQSFDVWPLHRMQILPDRSTRYRLTRDEKEQLKFLGKIFSTRVGQRRASITADLANAKRIRKNAVEKIRRK
jgi:hypothetical protein